MSSKKEEKAQDASERIKAAASSAAKGLSRAQAERSAAAAARIVNAYGQKEEGPSRWQEKREAKRQMYLMSTEKAVKLGERKDLKSSISSASKAGNKFKRRSTLQSRMRSSPTSADQQQLQNSADYRNSKTGMYLDMEDFME